MRKLAEREPVSHRHRACTDETLPALAQAHAFDRAAGRIRPIQDPHGLAALRALFQHVTQGRDERVDAAAEILQIDEQHIEAIHHRRGRTTHLTVETEDRNAERRIVEVRRLDHVVLLVAAQTVLRTERCGKLHVTASRPAHRA